MTKVVHVSQKEMENKTGFKQALGYSLPEEDTILVRKGLPKKLKKEVLAHEEEHIAKGEEGPWLGSLIGAGIGLLGAKKQSDAAKDAARAQSQAAADEIAYAKESRDLIRQDQAPWLEAGKTALGALMDMTGLAPLSATARGVRQAVGVGRRAGIQDYLRGLNLPGRGRAIPGFGRADQWRDAWASADQWRNRNAPFMPTAPDIMGRAYGGHMKPYGRAIGGLMWPGQPYDSYQPRGPAIRDKQFTYNVNELGPENIYTEGSVTRNPNPQTIDPSTSGYVQENPGGREGGYSFKADPGYNFRFQEGMRALERGAAAAGGLLSGGYGRRAIRYGQDYASGEYQNVYNRIANIAGLGQVANQANANAALYTSGQVGGALSNAGAARASGYTARGDIWGGAIGGLAQLPWDVWFPGKGGGGGGGGGTSSGRTLPGGNV